MQGDELLKMEYHAHQGRLKTAELSDFYIGLSAGILGMNLKLRI